MVKSRLHIKKLGNNPNLTANVEEFAIAVPANINSGFFPLPRARPLDFQPRAHAGEMPTQRLCGRHVTPSLLWLGLTSWTRARETEYESSCDAPKPLRLVF